MILHDDTKLNVEDFLKAEFARINARDTGRPMTMAAMEDLVTEAGRRIQEKMLEAIIQENSIRIGPEKKTVRNAATKCAAKDSDSER